MSLYTGTYPESIQCTSAHQMVFLPSPLLIGQTQPSFFLIGPLRFPHWPTKVSENCNLYQSNFTYYLSE